MDNVNMVLKFRSAADNEFQVKGASRIKVDGRGGLVFQDAETGARQTICLQGLQSLRIQAISNRFVPLPLAG